MGEKVPSETSIDLLRVGHVEAGLDRVSEIAALRVRGVEAPDAAAIAGALGRLKRADLGAALREMCDIDPIHVVACAWGGACDVRRAIRASLDDPRSERSVELPKHTIESVHRPRLVLSVVGADWCCVEFKLTLAVTLASARLALLGGRLVGARLGLVSGSLKVECEDIEIDEFARKDLGLLPEYRFVVPIDLSRFAASAVPAAPEPQAA